MLSSPVVIKGTKSGIIVALDNTLPYEELKNALIDKFEKSSDFLGNTQVALGFEGRELNESERFELAKLISIHSKLNIVCIIEDDPRVEEYMNSSLEKQLMKIENNTGQFYKGNLRSGQVLEFESDITIIGNINAGAQVVSTGNLIIIGSLYGNVYAGASGKSDAFIVALKMMPTQIRINDVIARAPDNKIEENNTPQIAYIKNNNIYIENISECTFNDSII